MKLSFTEYATLKDYRATELIEKQIVYGNGGSYGQIVFLAGGAGSGKGFAIKNFMRWQDFKKFDVDELKTAFQELDRLGKFTTKDLLDKYGKNISAKDMEHIQKHVLDKGYGLKDLNLKTSAHVAALHIFVRATGAKNKVLDLVLQGAEKDRLPNLLFDSTFKDLDDLNTIIPLAINAGYLPKNIHLTWILTNYEIAIKNNKSRSRVVPDDILLATHRGAASTVYNLIYKGVPAEIDGGIYVVLNNPENTIYIKDPKTGKPYKNLKGDMIVKDFKYLNFKDPGKPAKKEIELKKQLLQWIQNNVPPNSLDTSDFDNL